MYSAEPSRLAPGTRLNGIFEIDQRIASGGMGEIYRGHAIETGDPVAIKVMRTDLADNATALALFRKEASALHYIHHEAIVRYYAFANDPGIGRHYLAMEFVDGQPLSELLHRGPLGFDAVRLLQERLAAGLSAAHQHGVIHRDLSPDNVLIPAGDLGKAKIIDFGIARLTHVGDGTIIGSGFAGKYNYVSPEQLGLFGGDITAKSDIYSLGLVLAQCLTGRPIDMGGTQFEVLEKRRSVPDLRAVDRRFRPLLEKMLQPNPADRPESMAAVAAWRPEPEAVPPPRRGADARDRGRPPPPRVASTPQPKAKPARRRAKVAAVVILLIGVGGVGLYFAEDLYSFFFDKDSPNPREPGPLRPVEGILDFANRYDGGDCFFVTSETVGDSTAPRDVDGLGRSVEPFQDLYNEFKRQSDREADIGFHQVMPAQCPAVNFLFRTRNQRGQVPRLEIHTAGLRSGGLLTGAVADFGSRHAELLLVGDDGYVFNITENLDPGSDNTRTFSFFIGKRNPGRPRPQLLIVVVSSKPLASLKLPPDGSPAEQVFSQVLAEALQNRETLNVSAKYFMLENVLEKSPAPGTP